jgi:hypothetical protein
MTVFVVRASRPHVSILYRPTDREFDYDFCKRLNCKLDAGWSAFVDLRRLGDDF